MFENAGFSAKKHRYHLYKLFSFPFLLAAMSLLGVSFNLNNFARKKNNLLFLIGILVFQLLRLIKLFKGEENSRNELNKLVFYNFFRTS